MAVGITDLPQELIDLVASYIQRWELDNRIFDWDGGASSRTLLPAYATISRAWQYAIECQTFHKIRIKSTDLDNFRQVLVNHRRKLLKRIEFEIILPAYDKACAKFETETDRQANNRVFTNAIKDLLFLLGSWHIESLGAGEYEKSFDESSLCLCIRACHSPMDFEDLRWASRRRPRPPDLGKHRYESSLLQLESIEDIQRILQVTSFRTKHTKRNIEPRSLAMIASKFPYLDKLCWSVNDNEKLNPLLRQQTRFAFAEAFSLVPHRLLKRLSLRYFNNPPDNQDLKSPSALIQSCPQIDHLSLAIHAISQAESLTHLDLGDAIVISPSLFWSDTQIKPPYWPNLVSVKLDFSMNTADGDWYFMREGSDVNVESNNNDADLEAGAITTEQHPDPDIPDTYNEKNVALITGQQPYRHYRSRADPGKLNPLFAAAAKAAAYMPQLQRMSLSTVVKGSTARRSQSGMFSFGMTYSAPGDVPRLDWAVGPSGYEPEESILELWRLAKGEVVQSVTSYSRHSWLATRDYYPIIGQVIVTGADRYPQGATTTTQYEETAIYRRGNVYNVTTIPFFNTANAKAHDGTLAKSY